MGSSLQFFYSLMHPTRSFLSSRESTALSAFTTIFYLSSTTPIPEDALAKVRAALSPTLSISTTTQCLESFEGVIQSTRIRNVAAAFMLVSSFSRGL